MKKSILFVVLIFGLFATKVGTDEIFGEKLPKPAKVQVVNNVTENDIIWSEGPYIRVFGISNDKDKIINETIGREKSANVLSGYDRLFCVGGNSFLVLPLKAEQDYIVRIEGKDTYTATMINITTGAIQTIQSKNYW
jgi:hypothetical protein